MKIRLIFNVLLHGYGLANISGKTGTLNLGNGTTAGTLSAATITGGNGTAVENIKKSASYTLGSNMTGSLALNHTGTGTTNLTGANTYAGNTAVSAGTLNVNGSTSASSRFTVASGATLGGNGTIGGATMIYGIHSPGNSREIPTPTSPHSTRSSWEATWPSTRPPRLCWTSAATAMSIGPIPSGPLTKAGWFTMSPAQPPAWRM